MNRPTSLEFDRPGTVFTILSLWFCICRACVYHSLCTVRVHAMPCIWVRHPGLTLAVMVESVGHRFVCGRKQTLGIEKRIWFWRLAAGSGQPTVVSGGNESIEAIHTYHQNQYHISSDPAHYVHIFNTATVACFPLPLLPTSCCRSTDAATMCICNLPMYSTLTSSSATHTRCISTSTRGIVCIGVDPPLCVATSFQPVLLHIQWMVACTLHTPAAFVYIYIVEHRAYRSPNNWVTIRYLHTADVCLVAKNPCT